MASSASNATTIASPQLPGVVDESVAKKVALAALVGTALEWYDFFLFTTPPRWCSTRSISCPRTPSSRP